MHLFGINGLSTVWRDCHKWLAMSFMWHFWVQVGQKISMLVEVSAAQVILHLDDDGRKEDCPVYVRPDYLGIVVGESCVNQRWAIGLYCSSVQSKKLLPGQSHYKKEPTSIWARPIKIADSQSNSLNRIYKKWHVLKSNEYPVHKLTFSIIQYIYCLSLVD